MDGLNFLFRYQLTEYVLYDNYFQTDNQISNLLDENIGDF